MKLSNLDLTKKIEITVEKTIEAIARIERFIIKYGFQLTDNQKEKIANKIKDLQKYL